MQGFAPATRECALCGTSIEQVKAFDVSYGGALCDECLGRLGICTTIDSRAAAWIEALLFSTFAQIADIESYPEIELLDLAHMWVCEHAGFELKSIAFLKTLLMGMEWCQGVRPPDTFTANSCFTYTAIKLQCHGTKLYYARVM